MTIHLEYTCTEAEIKEAQSLLLRQHYGRGSKWRTRLVLFGILLAVLGLAWLQFVTEIAPKDRPWFLVLAGVIFVGFLVVKRFTRRRKNDQLMRLDISEMELVFDAGNGRTVMPWSAFGQCLESPTLFVLLNSTKTVMWTIPMRSFPDEKSQSWFRTLANQPRSAMAPADLETFIPGRFATKGIALTVQLGYRDYLTRIFTSWRTRGMGLLVMAIFLGVSLYSFANPPPDAVVPPGKVCLIMIGTMLPMLAVVFFMAAFISWRSERKFLKPEHVTMSDEGIHFSSSDGKGLLTWTTYKCYLENHWAFFVWNPRASVWMMFPKRLFTSTLDVEQCRELLRSNLQESRWFFY